MFYCEEEGGRHDVLNSYHTAHRSYLLAGKYVGERHNNHDNRAMRTLLRLKQKKNMMVMDNEAIGTMKDDAQSSPPISSTDGASANNNDPPSLTHQMQKDTASEKADNIATECNDTAIAMKDDNNQFNTAKGDGNDDELIILDGENNALSLIPQILRSAVERSRQAEELLLRDDIMMMNKDIVAPIKERTAVIDSNKSSSSSPLFTKRNENPNGSFSPAASKNLLHLPPSWKRSNYASKTLAQIEEYVAKSNSSNSSTKIGSSSNHDGRNDTNSFTVEYNECSLAALANWAMMDTSSSSTTTANNKKKMKQTHQQHASSSSTSTPPPPPWTQSSSWSQYKQEQEKLRATNTTKYNMPIPPPSAFRMCGICHCFGHYEVECDFLVEYDDFDKEDVVIVGGDSSSDEEEECTMKKKKGRKRKRLEEQEKQGVISSLAKELRIQRTLERLLSNARREKKAKKKEEEEMLMMMTKNDGDGGSKKRGNHHHHHGNDEGDNDDASYWVTSQRCNVCLSALGDVSMLVCDGCDELFHMHCLDPPLRSVPEGDWFCDACHAYDDDISSTVDVEGCGEFVIEQRKRSLAEEERRKRSEEDYVSVSIGGENPWITALSILAQEDPDVGSIANFKALYVQRGDDDGDSGRTEFVENEVVWAKRQVGSIKYWPGIVSKVAKKGLDVLYFPLGDNNLNRLHHHSELLPFFPYFEDLGYDQVFKNDLFHRALELSVIKTGLKTLGQALNYARCGTQMSLQRGTNEFRNTTAARALKGAGWVAPVGWENAEVDEVDGILIVAKSDADGNKKPRPSVSINNATTSSESVGDKSSDECDICKDTGDLLVCDGGGKGGGCDKAFHIACIDRDEIPEGTLAAFARISL